MNGRKETENPLLVKKWQSFGCRYIMALPSIGATVKFAPPTDEADGVGFEPTMAISHSCLANNRHHPLDQPSEQGTFLGFEPKDIPVTKIIAECAFSGK